MAAPAFVVKPEICKVEHIPAVKTVVKIKDCDVASCHVNVVVAVAEIKVNKTITLCVGRERSECFEAGGYG